MNGTNDVVGTVAQAERRVISRLMALVTVATGFGLALTAKSGVLDGEGWLFWLALAAGPVLVTLGCALYLRRRDQVRRESAWDIFVERELERESGKPAYQVRPRTQSEVSV